MSEFKPPEGTNFNCRDFIPIASLSKDLCKIAAFLQDKYPYVPLQRFDDWWQHDGLHFEKGTLDWHGLFSIVGSSKTIYQSMPGDDYVRVGIAPSDGKWYLRFYATWDDEGNLLQGDYDITLPSDLVVEFRQEIIPDFEASVQEESSQTYFQRVIA